MKKVILMRHAKSSWDHPGMADHSRPLNSRGIKDAPEMARRLQSEGHIPDKIYSSDSQRTRETYEGLSSVLGSLDVEFSRELYHSSAMDILRAAQNADDSFECIMILAHNPGMTYAFEKLARVRVDNVPTSGIGVFQFDVESFADITEQSGKLLWFSYPKKI